MANETRIVTTLIWLSFSLRLQKINGETESYFGGFPVNIVDPFPKLKKIRGKLFLTGEPFKRSELVHLSEIGVWEIQGYTQIPCKHSSIK